MPTQGEQLDSFSAAAPNPIDEDQQGLYAVSAWNRPDPALDLIGNSCSGLRMVYFPPGPDGHSIVKCSEKKPRDVMAEHLFDPPRSMVCTRCGAVLLGHTDAKPFKLTDWESERFLRSYSARGLNPGVREMTLAYEIVGINDPDGRTIVRSGATQISIRPRPA